MSDDAFFDVASRMLGELDDGHVWLLKPGPGYRRYDSGPAYASGDFKPEIARSYLQEVHELPGADGPAIRYGKLPGNIGYVIFNDLAEQPSWYRKSMEEILRMLGDTQGMVVDARNITGGDDRAAQVVAGHFATERALYMTTRFRNGPRHGDFTAPLAWYVAPKGNNRYTGPVVLLTNRTTQSAGETFTLAMRQISNVTQVGDSTFGIFSDNPQRELPNGWVFTVSTGDFRAADGKNYEGIGLAPQVLVQNREEEVAAGQDKALEKAAKLLSR
jgi:C-terminal processing protease CtpA/Prc